MNKLVVSVGLAASGILGLEATCAAQTSLLGDVKNWNASASLRGFYDDNYSIGARKHGSYGIELSPTITATIPLTQTQIGFLYTYGLQYYQQRNDLNVNPYDQSHTVNLWVDHAFNERWNVKVSDSFNVGQEPELLSGGNSVSAVPYRLNGNNIANNGKITLHTDWTPEFSTELIYANNYYQYSELPYSGELNRLDNSPELDFQWHLAPETTAFVGYSFTIENFTENAVIGTYGPGGIHNYLSDSRDNINHYGYVGLQHNFLPNLVGSMRVGVQYYESINDPLKNTSDLSPYADLSLIYTYLPGCNAEVGFTESRNATDVVSVNTVDQSLTQDQLSSTLYASVNHHITQKLLLSVIGKWTDSTFNGGQFDNKDQTDYGLGINANYAFTRHFSAEAGYNYDNVSAPAGTFQTYERNRFYIGISVAY